MAAPGCACGRAGSPWTCASRGGRSGLGVPAYLENGVGSGLLIKLVVMPAALGTFLVLPAALAQAALVQWWGYPLPLASALLFCAGVTVSGLAGEVQRLEHVFAVELLNTRSRVDATGLRVWHHGIPELELDHVRNLRVESAEPDAPAQLVAVTDAGEQVLARGFERQDLEFVALKLADRLRGEA